MGRELLRGAVNALKSDGGNAYQTPSMYSKPLNHTFRENKFYSM